MFDARFWILNVCCLLRQIGSGVFAQPIPSPSPLPASAYEPRCVGQNITASDAQIKGAGIVVGEACSGIPNVDFFSFGAEEVYL